MDSCGGDGLPRLCALEQSQHSFAHEWLKAIEFGVRDKDIETVSQHRHHRVVGTPDGLLNEGKAAGQPRANL